MNSRTIIAAWELYRMIRRLTGHCGYAMIAERKRKDTGGIKMSFCTECGYRLPDDSLFCPGCGAPVRDYAEPQQGGEKGGPAGGGPTNAGGSKSAYGYSQPNAQKSGGGRVAAIVISVVVLLFITAGYLLEKTISSESFTGYWESVAVEVNGEEKDSYLGRDIDGLFGLQIDRDGTASMSSAFSTKVFQGKWQKVGSTLTITGSGENYSIVKKKDRLYLNNNGLYIVYKKADGDIDHPTVPRGSLAGGENGSEALPSPKTTEGAAGYLNGKDVYVAFTGAEAFTDTKGRERLRVYFTFKNCTDRALSADATLVVTASQNGEQLEAEDPESEIAEDKLFSAMVRPNVTIQCSCCFDYEPEEGDVSLDFRGWYGEDSADLRQTLSADKLPGAPAPLAIEPVTEPKWTAALAAQGKFDDYELAVTGAELTTDENGEAAVRVRYSFKNDGDEGVSMEYAVFACTYQDGVSLEETTAAQVADSDRLFEKEIKPGRSAVVSRVFKLRNKSSQIEAEVESNDSYDAIGQTFAVPG